MRKVTAISSFTHDGISRRRGDQYETPARIAEQLARAGLVQVFAVDPAKTDPTQPAGTPLSASPAGQALPQPTATKLDDGDTVPTEPAPTEPAPTEPAPTEPAPTEQAVPKTQKKTKASKTEP